MVAPPGDRDDFDALRAEVRANHRRAHLVASARRLFAELGFPDCTIERIAQRAGVAKSTVYAYFDSKEALLDACRTAAASELSARLERTLVRKVGQAARVEALFSVTFAHIDAHASLYSGDDARSVDGVFRTACAKLETACGVDSALEGGFAETLLYGALAQRVRGEASEPAARAAALSRALLRALGPQAGLEPGGEER